MATVSKYPHYPKVDQTFCGHWIKVIPAYVVTHASKVWVFVQKSAWMQVLAGLAEETDYDNFTSEVGFEWEEVKEITSRTS